MLSQFLRSTRVAVGRHVREEYNATGKCYHRTSACCEALVFLRASFTIIHPNAAGQIPGCLLMVYSSGSPSIYLQ